MITNNRKDKAAKCQQVQQYLWAMVNWLAENHGIKLQEYMDEELSLRVSLWLGSKSPEKERLVRMLIARFTYDNYSMKKLQGQIVNKKLLYSIDWIDIFDIHFGKRMDNLFQIIGKLAKGDKYAEPCSCNDEQKTSAEYEFSVLNQNLILKSPAKKTVGTGIEKTIKNWLTWKTSRHLQLHYSFSEFLDK